jgi:glycosyltransferase involved in cell wall biosynthesis
MVLGHKLKIAVAHLSLNFFGGEERLCLSVIEALKLTNNDVTLFTVEKTDWAAVFRLFGSFMRPNTEIFSKWAIRGDYARTSSLVSVYTKYLEGLLRLRRKYDLVINTYGDLFNSIAGIAYVHFPIKATLSYSQTPVFASPAKWAAYCRVYNCVTSIVNRFNPSLLLTNSKFTQQIVTKYLERRSLVLYPPVDVKAFARTDVKSENLVVTVSKFTPKKCLHKVPLIAKNTHNAKFIIVGGTNEYSGKTIADVRKVIKDYDLNDHVILMPNLQRSKLMELLVRARVYLHVMPSEHFGISIIEAMAAGCVPVVHRSGGPWLDILDQRQGKYGFSYETPEEAAFLIDDIMSDDKLANKVSHAAQERSWKYDESVFGKNLQMIIDKLVSNNR